MLSICERCHTAYTWTRSTSTLKLTYCNILCERGALGFTIDALLQSQRRELSPADDWVVLNV